MRWCGHGRSLVLALIVGEAIFGSLQVAAVDLPAPSTNYRFDSTWGQQGAGAGDLDEPIGIALAPGEIYVSDAGNHRIQVFDRQGRLLRTFGERGAAPGQLARPMHLTFHDGRLYVAEYLNDRIQVFTPEGVSTAILGSSGVGPGQFDAPAGVAVDAAGRLYVADFYNQRIQLLSPAGELIRQLGETGRSGSTPGQFQYPTGVAMLADGSLAVADAYNDRVQIFDSTGTFRSLWDGSISSPAGAGGEKFRTAMAVTAGPDGTLFVADFYNHRIRQLTVDGEPLASFGGEGRTAGRFNRPTDLAVAEDGSVYVVDFGNHRIQKFAPASPKRRSDR